MQTLTVHLDRVFDMCIPSGSKRNTGMLFSCVASGETHYSVLLPGQPRVQVGDWVTVVLSEPDNWQSLVGWKNHSNGEVLVRGRDNYVVLPIVSAIWGLLILAWYRSTEHHLWLSLIALVSGYLLLVMASGARTAWRAARLLAQT